jgi:hypothetical protein
MSITTLEDVFLSINREFGEDGVDDDDQLKIIDENRVSNVESPISPTGMKSYNPKVANDTTEPSIDSKSRFSALYSNTEISVDEPNNLERLIHESSFSSNVSALMTKRFHIYKRDRTGLVCEILVPSFLVLCGSASTLLNWYGSTAPRTLSPTLYPSQQRLLMNENNIVDSANSVSPATFYNNLPSVEDDFWSPTFNDCG